MNFMVYLNGTLQPVNSYTIDEDGILTIVNWMSMRPSFACNPGDVITIMFYTGGTVTKRTDNVCNSYVQLGESPTYSATETFNF